ncbi:hypothetical protein AUC70_05940 [Methyloceanibacter stevinii]|uniref:Biopolymer transporter ExbD n=2 Tax=Methyloceanibacter stevinii TaxID=1774970 RepID=A0A1E3VNW7_9HYPH|nr:hypothetical protein AUC70_05940 [Methyloceanibacter stevinii]
MINVVFLLLIFFLLTAQIAPPPPFEVAAPSADETDLADGTLVLYLGADGRLGFREAVGYEAVLAGLHDALRDQCGGPCSDDTRPIAVLRADKSVNGSKLAALLPKLAALGLRDIQLVTVRK